MSLSANFEAHSFAAKRFCRLLFSWSRGRKRTSSLFFFGGIHFQIAWLAWFKSGTPIKYDRTCQQSIEIISTEKTFALHKSAQKKHFFLEFFLKESSWWALFNRLKIANLEKWWFLTLEDKVEWLWGRECVTSGSFRMRSNIRHAQL